VSQKAIKTNPVPHLEVDATFKAKKLARCDIGVKARVALEMKIVWNLLNLLKSHGWVCREEPRERMKFGGDIGKAMEAIFDLDIATVRFTRGDDEHWVIFVFGNNGWDCISDYSYDRKGEDEFGPLIDNFDSEEYF